MKNTNRAFYLQTLIISACIYMGSANAGQSEINQIEQAASTLNVSALKQMSNELSGYDYALNQYRLALSANLTNQSDMAKKAIDKSMAELEKLEQQDPENAEIKALLAQVYGYKIAIEPFKGVYYGPKSGNAISQAESLSPNNPRVQLVKGIGALNTPAMFGGSSDVAFDSFNKAIVAFADDQYSDYHWGFAEAYTWRGLVHQQRGDMVKAKADWQKAIEIDQNYAWAKSLLTNAQG